MIATDNAAAGVQGGVIPHPRACSHHPPCPSAEAPDHDLARLVVSHPEQGWGLLCNGVVVFDDTGELLPGGRAVAPLRAV